MRVEIFDQGKLYIDDEVVGAVQSGAIEMGLAGINQISRKLPAADIMEQPFLFNFEALTRAAVNPERGLRKLLDGAVLEAIGVRVALVADSRLASVHYQGAGRGRSGADQEARQSACSVKPWLA